MKPFRRDTPENRDARAILRASCRGRIHREVGSCDAASMCFHFRSQISSKKGEINGWMFSMNESCSTTSRPVIMNDSNGTIVRKNSKKMGEVKSMVVAGLNTRRAKT